VRPWIRVRYGGSESNRLTSALTGKTTKDKSVVLIKSLTKKKESSTSGRKNIATARRKTTL